MKQEPRHEETAFPVQPQPVPPKAKKRDWRWVIEPFDVHSGQVVLIVLWLQWFWLSLVRQPQARLGLIANSFDFDYG